MQEVGHRLKIEDSSMIGWCIKNGQARIALDVGTDAVFFNNPDLPDTRSEMTLPLTARGAIIGALDVQSEASNALCRSGRASVTRATEPDGPVRSRRCADASGASTEAAPQRELDSRAASRKCPRSSVFAHGAVMMLAMYVTFVLNTMGVDPYLSLFVAMPLLFLLGVAIQKYLLNPLIKADTILPENQVLMTVGIGMVLTEIVRFTFTSDYKYITTTYSNQTFFLGNTSFSMALVIAFGIAMRPISCR